MFNKGLVSVRRQSNFPANHSPLLDFCCCFRGKHAPLVISMQTFEVTTCRPIIWQLQVLILTFLICLIQMTLNQLCEKMNTENNLINTADIFDIFILFDTDGGLKDLELKNKKITHYCQEGKIFSVLLLHIIKKGALAHLLKEQKTFENIHIYCNYVYPLPISRADIHVLLLPHLSVRHRDKCCEHSFISTFTTCTLYPRHLISTI